LNRGKRLLWAGLLLILLPACHSGSDPADAVSTPTSNNANPAPYLTTRSYPDIWEVVRSLYHSVPPLENSQEVVARDAGAIGVLNSKGLLYLSKNAFLLAHPMRIEAFARAQGASAVFATLSRQELDSPEGRALVQTRGYLDAGLLYSSDSHGLVRKFTQEERLPSGNSDASGLSLAGKQPKARAELLQLPYSQLPNQHKPYADNYLRAFSGSIGFFLKRPGPDSPALGGIIATTLPAASYGQGLYVEGFWVSPEIRRTGYGKVLMDHLVRWAGNHGIQVISLGTHQGLSYPFYDKYGFKRSFTLPDAVVTEAGEAYASYEYILEASRFPAVPNAPAHPEANLGAPVVVTGN
jgi:GNAT superfamily N-acetyltransferase